MADTNQKPSPSTSTKTTTVNAPVQRTIQMTDGPNAPINSDQQGSLLSGTGYDLGSINQSCRADGTEPPAAADAPSAQAEEVGHKDLNCLENQDREPDQAQQFNPDYNMIHTNTIPEKCIADKDMDTYNGSTNADMDVGMDNTVKGGTHKIAEGQKMESGFRKRKGSEKVTDVDDNFHRDEESHKNGKKRTTGPCPSSGTPGMTPAAQMMSRQPMRPQSQGGGQISPAATPGQMQSITSMDGKIRQTATFAPLSRSETTRGDIQSSGPVGRYVDPVAPPPTPLKSGIRTMMDLGLVASTPPAAVVDLSDTAKKTPAIKVDGRTKAGRVARAQEAAATRARREAEDQVGTGFRPLQPRSSTRSQCSRAKAIERTHQLVQRQIERAETAVVQNQRHEAARTSLAAASRAYRISEGVNKVREWQEATRKSLNEIEDAKMHAGSKYERKSKGSFKGKLVSQPVILNIDGEDFIEYRVLMKPSFN